MQTVYQRLDDLQRIGVKLGLRNIQFLLQALGNPHKKYPSILIAGTNGKGSVTAMLEAALVEQGYKTASYTSPHLIDLRERIKVNHQPIESRALEVVLQRTLDAADQLMKEGKLENAATYFEVLTVAAFLYFAEQNVEMAVVEVGMGGRFDATNVLSQELSIITTIAYDHEEFLGKSLAQIAAEKAGIIKDARPVIVGQVPSEAREVILAAASQKGASIALLDPLQVTGIEMVNGFPEFSYTPWNQRVRVHLRGRHQIYNSVLVLMAADALQLDRERVLSALRHVNWPARLEILSENPIVLLDCAHNPMGVQSLIDFLSDIKWHRVLGLFTAMKDKKISAMLKTIKPFLEKLFLTRVEPFTRCAVSEALMEAADTSGILYRLVEPASEAFSLAVHEARERGLPLVIFGSIYLAGEIYKLRGGLNPGYDPHF